MIPSRLQKGPELGLLRPKFVRLLMRGALREPPAVGHGVLGKPVGDEYLQPLQCITL
jgi:hypothetical protein